MKNAGRALLLLATIAGLVFAYFAYDVYSCNDDGSEAEADAVIVLGASIDGAEPSPVFRERLNHGIELLKSGKVDWLILTGGCPDGSEIAEATVGRAYAIRHGVPEDRILVETQSHTTYQNLYYAREVARQNHVKTVVIVSDPFHLRRAMRIAAELGLDARASGTPTSKLNNGDFLLRETLRNVKFVAFHGLLADAEARELAISAH